MREKKLKKVSIILSISLIIVLASAFIALAESDSYIDPDIPESWYEAPKPASEWGIEEFNQSPLLDEKVEQGDLPEVEERLPENPPVIETYKEIGKYGGQATTWTDNLHSGHDADYMSNMTPTAGQPSPDGTEMFPYYVKGWDFSEDYSKFTLYLREGVKWSDGEPLTADDYLFWWEHEAHNEDWATVPPEDWEPYGLMEVEKVDDYTVTFQYEGPIPRVPEFDFQNNMGPGIWGSPPPAHFMKDFHPDFVGEEKVVEMAEEVDLERWDEYYGRIRDDSPDHPEYEYQRPVLKPFRAIERSETNLLLERNPYYPFVDQEGNQLPYIDRINVQLANDQEMIATKAATGEATFSGRHLQTRDIPLYKRNEQQEDYRTLLYQRPFASDVLIQFNLSHKDDAMRDLFQNKKFKQAVSHAINREEISNKIFFGEARPKQASVPPLSKYYKEEHEQAYAEYDLEKAEELLDEIDMVDQNDDGFREMPNGDRFNPTLLYCSQPTGDHTPVLELVRKKWEELGLDIELKMVSRELYETTWGANDGDIGLWIGDMAMDLVFGAHSGKWLAPTTHATQGTWPAYVNWYESGGDEGMEPPENIKQLNEWSDQVRYSPDEETRDKAAEKLLESHAENLWTIGLVGMAPHPVIVDNSLKNVPDQGLWGWSVRYMRPMYPVQFYLDE
ncbi:MAG: ABC transporter substrate-binding protein [Halanaerobiaceae bacterium]